MGNLQYNKLLRRTSGPYRLVSVQLHTVEINEDRIPNAVSADSLKLSRTRTHVTDTKYKKMQTTRPLHEHRQQRAAVKDAKKTTKNDTAVPEQFVVSHISRHVDTPQGKCMWKNSTDMVNETRPSKHHNISPTTLSNDIGLVEQGTPPRKAQLTGRNKYSTA